MENGMRDQQVKSKDKAWYQIRAVVWARLLVIFAALFFSLGGYGITARAAAGGFTIEAALVAGGDGSTYDVRVTVLNSGADWEGTVRLLLGDIYRRTPSAYDTDMALPSGSRKQFTVRIPADSVQDKRRSTVTVELLDRAGRQAASEEFPKLLDDGENVLRMGILSDNYASLTYLDMGGQELYYYGVENPVKLVELDQDSLAQQLDSLAMLVIDRYNTEVLSDEDLEAIEYWVEDGGLLILGTGSYAEDTLKAFQNDPYLEMRGFTVHSPGEKKLLRQDRSESLALTMDRLALAELQTKQNFYDANYYDYSGVMVGSRSLGACAILPYSLTELGELDADAFAVSRTDFIFELLNNVSDFARMRDGYNGGYTNRYYEMNYQVERLFGVLSNSGEAINLNVLKVIVILYVILVGPVMYLILKALKKRELYWVTVPVTALLGIGLVYLAGRGFAVRDTRVYSVAVSDLAGQEERKVLLQCYDASHSEWKLKLAGDYEYIGPLIDNGYYYNNSTYYYHFQQNGDGKYFGIRPKASFESGFFQAGGADAEKTAGSVELIDVADAGGSIKLTDIVTDVGVSMADMIAGARGLSGKVVNRTDRDFACFAMFARGTMYLYGSLAAGESVELAELPLIYEGPPAYESSNYMRTLRMFVATDTYKDQVQEYAALGLGICAAVEQAQTADLLFIGVTEDGAKAVDDVCSEVSYGCFYAIY